MPRLLAGRLKQSTIAMIARDLRSAPAACPMVVERQRETRLRVPASSLFRRYPTFADLPDELVLLVLSFMRTASEVVIASEVCRKWRDLARDPVLWRNRLWQHGMSSKLPATVWPIQALEFSRWDDVDIMARFPQLRSLYLDGHAEPALLRQLATAPLTHLQLYCHCYYGMDAVLFPSTLLSLRACSTDQIGRFDVAARCPNLRRLSVISPPGHGEASAFYIPSLTDLALTAEIPAECLQNVAALHPSLTRLDLRQLSVTWLHLVDISVLNSVFSTMQLPHLRELILRDFCGIDDACVRKIAEHHPLLHTLDVTCRTRKAGAVFASLATLCPSLTTLKVRGSACDDAVLPFLPTCLTKLDVRATFVTFQGLRALPQRCPYLHVLCVDEGERLLSKEDWDAVKEVKRALPLYERAATDASATESTMTLGWHPSSVPWR